MRISASFLKKCVPQLKEFRIHLCQKSDASKGVREFVLTKYSTFKQDNPNLPILIRECEGVQPKLWARYELGKEVSVSLTNKSADEVAKELDNFGSRAQ